MEEAARTHVHADQRGSVVCIGVFDGVHRGHQSLLSLARHDADALGVPLVALTFDPHPMAVVGPRKAPTSLAPLEQRLELLKLAGADAVEVLAFDPDVAVMEPEVFVHRVLVDQLHARVVVVGRDFRFGHRAAGTYETLEREGSRHGFRAHAADLAGDGTQRWSSSSIRALIESGDVAAATLALGRPYRIDGVVVHGDHRGRDLGYPTANLGWEGNPTLPADGVYAGWLAAAGEVLPAAVSVGTNPQFDGRERRIEAYALDRDDLDLYGQPARVSFVTRIRGQQRFEEVSALVARMGQDVEESRRALGGAGAVGEPRGG